MVASGGSQAASLGVELAVDHMQLIVMVERELGFEDFKSKTFAALCIVYPACLSGGEILIDFSLDLLLRRARLQVLLLMDVKRPNTESDTERVEASRCAVVRSGATFESDGNGTKAVGITGLGGIVVQGKRLHRAGEQGRGYGGKGRGRGGAMVAGVLAEEPRSDTRIKSPAWRRGRGCRGWPHGVPAGRRASSSLGGSQRDCGHGEEDHLGENDKERQRGVMDEDAMAMGKVRVLTLMMEVKVVASLYPPFSSPLSIQ
ncbi:hypothetical protein NL676_002289 [Syzygium grande]|nr:hypothetical protein NL676_002289 [Syzygium grande]